MKAGYQLDSDDIKELALFYAKQLTLDSFTKDYATTGRRYKETVRKAVGHFFNTLDAFLGEFNSQNEEREEIGQFIA